MFWAENKGGASGMDISFLDEKGISTKDGIGYTGNQEKYISAIQRYFKGYENNKTQVMDYLEASDLENYCIKVHSLKSNSRMIGASALSSAFEELETASRNNDLETVKAKTEPALKMYSEVIEILRPLGEAEAVKISGELSVDEAKKTAEALLNALDDFDDALSLELAGKLSNYPFRITQKQRLREATDNIRDFLYDEAAELIREIVPSIDGD